MAANGATGIDIGELAGEREVRECLQWFTREKQWINETHLQLCASPRPRSSTGGAAWFLERFRALGWDASIDRAGNVIAGQGTGPYVALTAHLDTVIAPRNKDDISVEADGRYCGPAFPITAQAWRPCWRWRAPGQKLP